MRRKVLRSASVGLFVLVVPILAPVAQAAQVDEKLAKKVEKLDAQLAKTLSTLAAKYDELKDPEATHFFASSALGYGVKDDKLTGIKNTWEVAVFIGNVRGGKLLADAEPITSALRGLSQEYRGIRDALWGDGVRGNLGEASKKILRNAGVKMELTQNAQEYIRATQRINALRQAMGLRAVFWDFENSTRFILVAWYMGQTGDYNDNLAGSRSGVNKHHVLYTPAVEDAKKEAAITTASDTTLYPELLRPTPLHRQDLLNPNARTLWLGRWAKGYALATTVLYAIPQLPYREDIPTPGARFKDETLVKPWSGWIDTEDTLLVGEKKIPYVRYPYDGEPDAPFVCHGGEDGWANSEYKFLDKAGVPIMLRFFVDTVPTEIETGLTDGSHAIACRHYVNRDKRVPSMDNWATVLLLPEERLSPGVKYSVTVKCKLDSTPFEKSWSFTTRKE